MGSLPTLCALDASLSAPADLASLKPDLTLQDPIGEGGMGIVRAAQQCALGRSVAVKLLRPSDNDDPSAPGKAQALLREALIMGQLEHPNIIPVYTLGKLGPQQPALIMKRVEGVSWHALIHDPHHPRWAATGAADDRLGFHLSVLSQVCRALEFSHSRDIIHRDIKPENVMIGAYGEVYLLDWGIALHLRERAGMTKPALLGTPAYMAPEMARGDVASLDARADVYLVGATLHEVLTGRPPHGGANLLATLFAAATSAPAALGDEVPQALAEVVHRACAPDPSDRFPDAAAVREALTAYLRHRGSLALSAEAEAQAQALRLMLTASQAPDAQPALTQEAHALFAACAFGFQMSLREWPANPQATHGLRAVVEAMARAELARGDVEHAARLLDQHPDAADAALRGEVSQRLIALRSGRQDLNALLKLRDDMDIHRNQRQRQQLFASLGAAAIVVSIVLLSAMPRDDQMTWGQLFTALAFISALYIGAWWRLRRALMTTAIDRRIGAALGVFIISLWVQRLSGWSHDIAISRAFYNDLLLSALSCALLAVFTELRLLWAALPFLLGLGGAQLFPNHIATLFGVSGIIATGTLLFLFRRPTADAPQAPPPLTR
jgi:serine/threonine-protein kinase